MKHVTQPELSAFLSAMGSGRRVAAGSETHRVMSLLSAEAQRLTAKLNRRFRPPEKIRALMAKFIGRPVDPTFRLFPPFYTDCGKNLRLGKNVFVNAGCHFQDQGGLTLGDGCLIGARAAGNTYEIHDDAEKLAFIKENAAKATAEYVRAVMSRSDFWGEDLTAIAGFADAVTAHIDRMAEVGVKAHIEELGRDA